MQYVTETSVTSGVYTPRYIFGSIDQKILSLSLRIDYNITPDLTIQYWGQPFFGSVIIHDSNISQISLQLLMNILTGFICIHRIRSATMRLRALTLSMKTGTAWLTTPLRNLISI